MLSGEIVKLFDCPNPDDSVRIELVPERIYDVLGYNIEWGFSVVLLEPLFLLRDYYRLFWHIPMEEKIDRSDPRAFSDGWWLYHLVKRYRVCGDSDVINWKKFMRTMEKYYEFCRIDYFPDGVYDEDSYIEFKRFYNEEFSIGNEEAKLDLICTPDVSGKYSYYYKKWRLPICKSNIDLMDGCYWYYVADIFNGKYNWFDSDDENYNEYYVNSLINYLEKYPKKLSYLVYQWIENLIWGYDGNEDKIEIIELMIDYNMTKFFNKKLLDIMIKYQCYSSIYYEKKCIWMKLSLTVQEVFKDFMVHGDMIIKYL